MSEPLGKVSAMGDERRRILLTGEPRGHKEDSGMDREKMLDVTLQQIEKQFGKGAVMKLGEHPMGAGITVIPTGSLALDIALGVGGIPRGRIIEVFGPEGSGKTTVCLHMIAEAQARGGIAAFIDAEHALDPTYARALGLNVDELLVSQPDSGEQALEIADMLVRSAALDVVVVDSVAALVPRAEIEGEMGDTHVGLQARLMSQAMRKLAGTLSRFDTSAIFINQLREKIGVMFGSPETTPGGRALKFYSSVRLDIRKIENLKDGTDVVGSRTRVKVVKNKVAPPFRQCEFDIMYGKGISKEGSLIDVGVEQEIIKKAGAWFTYEGDQLGQGRENAKQFLAEHVDLRDEIERKVREAVGLTSFGAEGDETLIQVVPDLILEDREPEPVPELEPATAAAAAGKASKARNGSG
jgi:recombination protein RecA